MNKLKKFFYKYKKHFIPVATLLIITITILFINISYSRYTSEMSVKVDSTSGEMYCNLTLNTSEHFIENNVAYFRVKVNNYTGDKITATNIDYTLTISNEEGSNGIFYYLDSNGINESTEYTESITTPVYSFGTEKEEIEFKVFVKVPSGLKEQVKFKVDLNAVQKEM